MIFKVLAWIFAIWLGLWALLQVFAIIPFVIFLLATAIAGCCAYSLLPESMRVEKIEQWLGDDVQSPTSPIPSPPTEPSPPLPPELSVSEKPPSTPQELLSRPESPEVAPPTIVDEAPGSLPNQDELITALKSKVVEQDTAVEMIVPVCLEKLASHDKKPLVIFLLGSTETNKMELSEALAESLETKLIRFDMGEFSESFKASNLFSSIEENANGKDGGALSNAIRQSQQRCVFLFDESEKAHESLWQPLLTFFNEGRITDTQETAEEARKNIICLLTSDLKSEETQARPETAEEILRQSGHFRPEILGRIDKIIPLFSGSPTATTE